MITFNQVCKRYHNGQEALSNINMHVDTGEMAFITGHSGAGKSSLLKLIALIERSSSGQVVVGGHHLNKIADHNVPFLRRSIGMIFQDPHLLVEQSVFANVALPLQIIGYREQDAKRRVRVALDKVGLLHKEHVQARNLSSGEQQRVSIARAIVHKPALLIADEPTGNLDPSLSAEIMKLFELFNNVGVTVLIASHDISLIRSMGRRIYTLSEGRLL